MKTCSWTNCQERVYGKHEFCYYHRKVMTGKLSVADRQIYMPNKLEQEFAYKTDTSVGIDIGKMHDKLHDPVAVEIMKLSLHLLCKKTQQPRKHFSTDLAMMVLIHLDLPDTIEDRDKFIKNTSTKFVGKLLNQYNKETEYQKYELPFDSIPETLTQPDPESILIKEQEEAALCQAFYHAKKIMTKIERKVFSLLERGDDEIYVRNRLKLSRQRVNTLKLKACEKVKEFLNVKENFSSNV